ncbi:MAG: hypothetical protein C0494_11020 [Sphingobium sp.]|nr:hypothetical protein [Sphingobium sp.]
MRLVVIGMVAMMATSATAQVSAAPPPPPIAVPSATRVPPLVFSPSPGDRRGLPVTSIMVRMMLGKQILWNGPLNIGGNGVARISVNEPVDRPDDCNASPENRAYRQIELSINSQTYRSGNMPEYRLSARYVRPGEGADCPMGTRTIAIDQGFSLAGRKSFLFEGDGGMQVQIMLQ